MTREPALDEPVIPTDRDLLAAHLDGDVQAMNELVRRHRSMLWSVAYCLMRHRQDAEDLVQEATLRACMYAASYRGRSPVGAWLRTIVINACYLGLRRRDRLPVACGDGAEMATTLRCHALVEPDPAGAVELRLSLEKAVILLPEDNSTVFYFAIMCGLSEAETAAAVGIKRGTVKSRLARARELLAIELDRLRSQRNF